MVPVEKQPQANRFALFDSELGSQHTAKGMRQDVYESNNRTHSSNETAPSRQDSTPKYNIPLLLQVGASERRRRHIPGTSVGAAHNNAGISLKIPKEIIREQTFPYASLPAELRQMILRELVPTKSIWNGTSFPKSSPRRYQQDYFKTTKYLQNRALAH